MITTVVPDKTSGDVFTEAMWDTYIRDNLNNLSLGGTSLPGSPIDGRIYFYVADVTNGIVWNLRYRSASASANKWEYVGGGALYTRTTTPVASASGTYVGDANGQITIPRTGDYEITFGGSFSSSVANGYGNIGIMVGGAQPVGGERQVGSAAPTAGLGVAIPPQIAIASLTAGNVLGLGVSAPVGGTATANVRWMSIRPVRIQ